MTCNASILVGRPTPFVHFHRKWVCDRLESPAVGLGTVTAEKAKRENQVRVVRRGRGPSSPLIGTVRAEAARPLRRRSSPSRGGAVVVDDIGEHVYVTRRDSVAVYDLAGAKVGSIPDQFGAIDLILQERTLYVLAANAHQLTAFDLDNPGLHQTWNIGGMSEIRYMAATPGTFWFSYHKDSTRDGLSKLNLSTGVVTIGVDTVPRVADLVATSSPARLYACSIEPPATASSARSTSLRVCRWRSPPALRAPRARTASSSHSHQSARRLWTACGAPNSFNEWDFRQPHGADVTYTAASAPNALAISGDGQVVVGGTKSPNGDDLWVYDTGDAGVVETFSVDPGNVYDGMIAVNQTGDRVYAVTDQGPLLAPSTLRPVIALPPPAIRRYHTDEVALQGSGYTTVSAVKIGATSVPFTIVNDRDLKFVPPGLPIGTYPITLVNHWAENPSSLRHAEGHRRCPVRPRPRRDAPAQDRSASPSSGHGRATTVVRRSRPTACTFYKDGTGRYTSEYVVPATSTSLVLDSLPAEYRYGFKVSAVNSSGGSFYSALSPVVRVPGPDLGPFTSITSFIDRQFRDVVGRPPSEHESNDWLSKLRRNQARPIDLVRYLRASRDNQSNVDSVERLYLAYFERPADGSGLRYWSTRSRRGTTLSSISSTFARVERVRRDLRCARRPRLRRARLPERARPAG